MRTTIQRTIKTTHIYASTMSIENGAVTVKELAPVTIKGEPTEKEQQKAIKDRYGKATNFIITKTDVEETLYEISIEDFIKYATKVEK